MLSGSSYLTEVSSLALHQLVINKVFSLFLSIQASSLGGIVIVEKTQISDQYFLAVQKLVVLELGMVLLPVANQGEASQLITQLVSFCVSGQIFSKVWDMRITSFPTVITHFRKNTWDLKGVQHILLFECKE